MKKHHMFRKSIFVVLMGFLLIVTSSFFSLQTHFSVSAQTQSRWTEPVNLSQSSSTSNPVIAIDTNQNVHVIWQDVFNDYGYAYWNGEQWSEPVGRTYIFYPEIPTLVGGANGLVHIFWITDNGALLHSSAPGSELSNPNSLSPPQVLGAGVLNFHASSDSQGRLHLGYAQGPNENGIPTGVYYRQSEPGATSWNIPTAVYLSPYFRSITPNSAHVYTATTRVDDNLRVYLTFDNPALKRVFFAASNDGGSTWQEPLEVDAPNIESVTTTPFDIIVYPDQQNILLMWKDNLQSSFDCTQLYQYSTDGGASWSQEQTTFNNLVGCPQGNVLVPGPENSVLLMVDIQESAYLQAWNWQTWSEPQIQGDLNQFTDPVTFSDLNLTNKQIAVDDNLQLFVTGSDLVGNRDIWVTSRQINDTSDWYPPPQAWQEPQIIVESTGILQDPVVLSDNNGIFHSFWTQSFDPENPLNEWSVYYSQYDGHNWLEPVSILRSPDKFASEVSAAAIDERRIVVTWSGHESGDIYFAWAQPDRASSVFEWSAPQSLPKPANQAAQPEILHSSTNSLYVVYTIPINEGRGVYLIESTDLGETWSEPKLVFDAAEANWTAVDQAFLSQTSDGTLHVLISQKNSPRDDSSVALYYSNSTDGGETWSNPNLVIDQPVVKFDMLPADQLTIHRYWQTDVGTDSRLWHEISLDGGLTWITSTPLSVLGEPGPSAMVLDSLNRVHLLQRFGDSSGSQLMQHWEFRGNSWESLENLQDEDTLINSAARALSAAAGPDGRLVAVSQEQQLQTGTMIPVDYLLASSRLLDDQVFQITPVAPQITPTETPQAGTTSESAVTVTSPDVQDPLLTPPPATPTAISFEDMNVGRSPTSSISLIVIGVGSAIVIMILLFVIARLRGR